MLPFVINSVKAPAVMPGLFAEFSHKLFLAHDQYITLELRREPADTNGMDSLLPQIMCFVFASVLGYFFGRTVDARDHHK